MDKFAYRKYLESPHWIELKSKYLASKLNRGKCCVCKGTYRLQLHHKTYERLGKERLTDLCLMCYNCHWRYHWLDKMIGNKLRLPLFQFQRFYKDWIRYQRSILRMSTGKRYAPLGGNLWDISTNPQLPNLLDMFDIIPEKIQ